MPGTDRRCILAAKRYRAVRAPHVPPRRRLPRGAPGPGVPDQPGHGRPDRVRQGGHRRAVGRRRVRRALPALRARGAGPVPGADPRHRDPAGVHRQRRRQRGGAAAGPAAPGHRRPGRPVAAAGRGAVHRWPGPGSPTGTSRRTTCWSTMDGWSSSTCRRSWTWWPTRRGGSSSPGTRATSPPGSPTRAWPRPTATALAAPARRRRPAALTAGCRGTCVGSLEPAATVAPAMQGALACSGGEHLAQHVLQDAAVAVVVRLAGGVDAHHRVEGDARCPC